MRKTTKNTNMEIAGGHLKVFISYSHDSDEHKDWVLKLASHLRKHGVDVILDQWNMRLGGDLPFFMEQGLSTSQLVLCICSDKYVEKANAGKGGAGYEKKIMSADLMNDAVQDYIIPIKRNNTLNKMPLFLSGALYNDFEDDSKYFDKYKDLLERIYDEDVKKIPPLGKNPFKQDEISKHISIKIEEDKVQFYNPLSKGHVSFDYKKNSGTFIIGEGEYQFSTHWDEAAMGVIHCYRDLVKRIGYNPTFNTFPEIKDISSFDFSSRAKSVKEEEVVILENQNNKFAAIKVTKVFCNSVDINHLLEFDYKIYEEI